MARDVGVDQELFTWLLGSRLSISTGISPLSPMSISLLSISESMLRNYVISCNLG